MLLNVISAYLTCNMFEQLYFLLFVTIKAQLTPSLTFERRWKTKLDDGSACPDGGHGESCGYGTASMAISKDVIYVLNGAGGYGNAILRFDLQGNYLGEYPGWYNWPADLVVGPDGQVLVSAMGAMGDNGWLRPGLVLYDELGEFLHGYHEEQSGLTRPRGLSIISSAGFDGYVGLCDWKSNRTVILDIDWQEGSIGIKQELVRIPFVDSMVFTSQHIITISYVCCQLENLIMMAIFDMEGNLIREVKELPTGEVLDAPTGVAVDYQDNIWLSDAILGKTIVFDADGNYLGEVENLGSPQKIIIYEEKVYTLIEECEQESCETFVTVYSIM